MVKGDAPPPQHMGASRRFCSRGAGGGYGQGTSVWMGSQMIVCGKGVRKAVLQCSTSLKPVPAGSALSRQDQTCLDKAVQGRLVQVRSARDPAVAGSIPQSAQLMPSARGAPPSVARVCWVEPSKQIRALHCAALVDLQKRPLIAELVQCQREAGTWAMDSVCLGATACTAVEALP
jgi:hypothetical protein